MDDRYYGGGIDGYRQEGTGDGAVGTGRVPETARIPAVGNDAQRTQPIRYGVDPTEQMPSREAYGQEAAQPQPRQAEGERASRFQPAYHCAAQSNEFGGRQGGAVSMQMNAQQAQRTHQALEDVGYGSQHGGGYGAATAGGQAGGYGAPPAGPSHHRGPDRHDLDGGRRKSGSGKSFLMGVLGGVLVLAIAAAGFFGYNAIAKPGSGTVTVDNADGTQSTYTINASGGDVELSEAVAAKALPSVVSIDVYSQVQSGYSMFDLMQGTDKESDLQVSAYGSGVVITADGYIITNYHVVEGGQMFVVHFDDDSTAEATVVGGDPSSDIAVLKVDKQGLTPIEIGDSSQLKVGEWVMTIGAPFGLTKSCSAGIVSALYRNEALNNTFGTSFYVNMIQIDASVNPGNSGGALVNKAGQLVGINTITTSYSGDFAGVGMAIPSNYAMNIANQIIETGEVHYSFLGVQLGTVDAGTQRYYGVSVDKGAYVGGVVEGSPAQAAGIQEGDVIVSYNGKEVTTAAELIMDVRASNVGDTVELGIKRGNQDITVQATLALDTTEQAVEQQVQQEQQEQQEQDPLRMMLP